MATGLVACDDGDDLGQVDKGPFEAIELITKADQPGVVSHHVESFPIQGTFALDPQGTIAHRWNFSTTGGDLSVSTGDLTGSVDTVVLLYARVEDSMILIDQDDDGGEGFASSILAPLEAGDYQIVVQSYKSAHIGTFSLLARLEEPCIGQECSPWRCEGPRLTNEQLLAKMDPGTDPMQLASLGDGFDARTRECDAANHCSDWYRPRPTRTPSNYSRGYYNWSDRKTNTVLRPSDADGFDLIFFPYNRGEPVSFKLDHGAGVGQGGYDHQWWKYGRSAPFRWAEMEAEITEDCFALRMTRRESYADGSDGRYREWEFGYVKDLPE